MNFIKRLNIPITVGFLIAALPTLAETLAQEWKRGLSGAKLTSYSGSMISSNSTLTTIYFCRNGQYSYYKQGSWSAPGTAGGASNNTIRGRWDIKQYGYQAVFIYATDSGLHGSFPIYLQHNGRVNIGGTVFAVQRGGAQC